MKKTKFFLSLLIVLSFFSSCAKDEGLLTGSLIGFVSLYETDNTFVEDRSGVVVSVDGKKISTQTDTNGRYVLSGLTTGTYNLTFAKSGYGTVKEIGFQFTGGDEPAYLYTKSLAKIPSYNVTGLTATISENGIEFRGTFSGTSLSLYNHAVIFLGKSANVSSAPSNYTYAVSGATYFDSTVMFGSIFKEALVDMYKKGQTIYVVAYSESMRGDMYIDLATNRYYSSALGTIPSNVVSVVMPF